MEKIFQKLNTPEKVQEYIDKEIVYDSGREDRSIEEVVRDKKAECFNGALFAVACLLYHGYETSVVELLAHDDEEHILCVYRKNGRWGSIAQSKFLGLKSRNPIYETIRDLAASYVEFYFTFDGRLPLLSFTEPMNLDKYKNEWLTSATSVNQIAKDLKATKHIRLTNADRDSFYVSSARFRKEVLVIPKGTKIPRKYLLK